MADAIDYGSHAPETTIDYGSHAPVVSAPPEEKGIGTRLWESFVAALPHPIDAVKEWANRPAELGKAMSALHELNALHDQAAADPANKGKPVNQWKYPQASPQQQAIIDAGMTARLQAPDDTVGLAAPLVTAGTQAQHGDLAGAGGTLLGAAVPYVAGAALASPKAIPMAKAAAAGTKAAIPALIDNVSLSHPLKAMRAAGDVANAAKAEYSSAMTDATAAAHRADNPGVAVEPVTPQPVPDATPIVPADRVLPSGRRVPIPGQPSNPILQALDRAKLKATSRDPNVPPEPPEDVSHGTLPGANLEQQLQQSIEAARNGKPNVNAPVPSPKNAVLNTELKAQAAETSEGFKDAAQTQRALKIGKFLKDYLGEEPDTSILTDEHIKAAAKGAGVDNPSSTTIQKVRDLFTMGKDQPSTIADLMKGVK